MHSVRLRLSPSLRARDYVAGLTHNFYRYPARFSPTFAREVVKAFTQPGDVVFDPFVGGGTSAVEALALGRRIVASDLNPLGLFVTELKTTPLTRADFGLVEEWLSRLFSADLRTLASPLRLPEHHNVPSRILRTIQFALDGALQISRPRARLFARGALLRTAQWALDGREEVPSSRSFLEQLAASAITMAGQLEAFRQAAREMLAAPRNAGMRARLVRTSAAEFGTNHLPRAWPRPKLVVTSPPYMGVHVLYNRWQVNGRRETPMAYAIAGVADGLPPSHYAFGGRHRGNDHYLAEVETSFASIGSVIDDDARVVQLVSFANKRHLPMYLAAMDRAGFREVEPLSRRRLWRTVPNRRWYIRTQSTAAAHGREVLLVHRLRRPRTPAPRGVS
jgi:hypothetical protein